jgi:hypothetical protein
MNTNESTIGAPSARNIGRWTIEVLAIGIAGGVAMAIVRPDWYPTILVLVIASVLTAGLVVGLMMHRVVVAPGSLHRQTWRQIATRRPAESLPVVAGQQLVKMPDERWLIGGAAYSLRVPRWELGRLDKALADAGFAIEDRRAAWVREHPKQVWAFRLSWAVSLAGIWATFVSQANGLQLAALLCPAIALGGAIGMYRWRPPQTTGAVPDWGPDWRPDRTQRPNGLAG